MNEDLVNESAARFIWNMIVTDLTRVVGHMITT